MIKPVLVSTNVQNIIFDRNILCIVIQIIRGVKMSCFGNGGKRYLIFRGK